MKKIILLLILGVWWVAIPTSAQSYFNKRATLHSYSSILTSVLESNGKYYITGLNADSTNFYTPLRYGFGIKFCAFDKDGNILIDSAFQIPFRDIEVWSNSTRRLPDGTFVVAGNTTDTSGFCRLLLVRFDSTGHAFWHREYDKPVCQNNPNDFWQLRDFQPTGTGEWLLLSSIACPVSNNNNDFNLTKLDSSFNVIWNKQYGDNRNNTAGHLLIESNSYILAGGYNTENIYPSNTTFKAEIFKVDTEGNVLNHVLLNNPKRTNGIRDIIKTQDGGYVYCGQGVGYEEPNGPMFAYINFKGWVQKLDANFNPVWADSFSTYATTISTNELVKIAEMQNGDLVVAGNIIGGFLPTDTPAYNYGCLIRLSASGDFIWGKKYKIPNDTLVYGIYDMKRTLDGGFILAGEAKDSYYPYTPPTQQAWLIKVDSNGCSSANDPQCWAVAVPHDPRTATSNYKVYPNPVSDHLSIYYSNVSGSGATIHIIDMMGRKIVESPLPGKTGTANIDVRNLQSGVYLYRILEGGKTMQTGKVTKQ